MVATTIGSLRYKQRSAVLAIALGLAAHQLGPPPGALLAAQAAELAHPQLDGLDPAVASQLRLSRLRWERLAASAENATEAADALGELIQLYHAYGFVEPAVAGYRRLRELLPTDPRWPHLLGVLLQAEGRHAESEQAFLAALEMPPVSPAVRIHLARLWFDQGRFDDAARALVPTLEAAAVDPAAIACQGELLLERGEAAEAARMLDLALGLVPAANRLHYPLANALRQLGDLEGHRRHLALAGEVGLRPADPLLDRLETLQTGHAAHSQRAQRAFAKGRFDDAAAEFEKALAVSPEHVPTRVGLAAAVASAGDSARAITLLREALRLEPDNATAHFNLGTLLSATGAFAEAAGHLRLALALRPTDADAHLALARALAASGERDAATAELRALLERQPGAADAWLTLARWQADAGDWPAAVQTLEHAYAALPRQAAVSAALARALAAAPEPSLRDGARAHALALESFAADERPSHAEAVALALAELGRCTEAAVWQREALSRLDGSEGADVRARLEGALERMGAGKSCRPSTSAKVSSP